MIEADTEQYVKPPTMEPVYVSYLGNLWWVHFCIRWNSDGGAEEWWGEKFYLVPSDRGEPIDMTDRCREHPDFVAGLEKATMKQLYADNGAEVRDE